MIGAPNCCGFFRNGIRPTVTAIGSRSKVEDGCTNHLAVPVAASGTAPGNRNGASLQILNLFLAA